MPRNGGRWFPLKFVGKADFGRAFGHQLDPMDSVGLRTASMEWNVPGKYGPPGELFFFLIRKEPATVPGSETFTKNLANWRRQHLGGHDVHPE